MKPKSILNSVNKPRKQITFRLLVSRCRKQHQVEPEKQTNSGKIFVKPQTL